MNDPAKKSAQPILKVTSDRSHTLWHPLYGENYHSLHGAIQESLHVFIGEGYRHTDAEPLHILEAGFGTGLNALLTLREVLQSGRHVHYTAVELHPLPPELVRQLNYPALLEMDERFFLSLHEAPWGSNKMITPGFTLLKLESDLLASSFPGMYDLVYFDAFSAAVQPELWTEEVFGRIGRHMHKGGVLVTYASRGNVRRALQRCGFTVEKVPGPPGKREMLRAVKK